MEDNLVGHVSFVQERCDGMVVERREGLTIVDSGLPSDTFNKVVGARLEPDTAEAHIDEALLYFRERGRPFTWWIGPCSRPLDFEERLSRRGLHPEAYELGMTLDLEARALPAPDVPENAIVRPVESPRELADFAAVLAGLAEPPDALVLSFFERAAPVVLEPGCPMRCFVAYVDGEPAATSELYLSDHVAGVYMVATGERFRRRGLGMALTWNALELGRRLGARVGALQASVQGQPVYERLGFEACGKYVELVP